MVKIPIFNLSAVATTIASASVVHIWVWNLICRNRRRIDCIDNLLRLRCHCCGKQCTLTILGSGSAKIIVLSLQGSNLVLAKVVKDASHTCILVVNNISGVAVHSVLQCASVSCHIVIYTLNSFACLAAILLPYRFFILYFYGFPP